jgi:hypothetical protein
VNTDARRWRAGESIEDYCRACRIDRAHTIMACDPHGHPVRVVCSYCRSEHNYRGGPRMEASAIGQRPVPAPAVPAPSSASSASSAAARKSSAPEARSATPFVARSPFPAVSERERSHPPMNTGTASEDLEMLLRRVIREEAGVSAVAPAEKWRGGDLVLRPGTPGLQEKSWPIETFFHKIVMLRNRLRTLEQQLNASDIPEDAKVKMQSYITGCYGSLTSFNVLFADPDDQFKGAGGD